MRSPATIHDVATRAGCSVASVSRVLNGTGPASADMRARVEAAMGALDFRPSEIGRSLARQSRRVLGVLVPSVTNPVFAACLAGIQVRARMAGCSVLMVQSDYDARREAEAVEALLAERPLGLILTVCDPARSAGLEMARAADLPSVLLFNEPDEEHAASVAVDNRAATRALVAEMLALGHRRAVFVAGRFASSDRSRLRYHGFRDALGSAGLAVPDPVEIDFIDGLEALDLANMLARERPSALVASNDVLAFGVMAAMRRAGLGVPEDVSVTGFDGIPIGRLIHPTLATVEQPAGRMGESAAALLFDLAAERKAPHVVRAAYAIRLGGTLAAPKHVPADTAQVAPSVLIA